MRASTPLAPRLRQGVIFRITRLRQGVICGGVWFARVGLRAREMLAYPY